MSVELTYSERHKEHSVTVDGEVVATAHCVFVPTDMWSVKFGDRVVGLAKGEQVAVATLEKIAGRLKQGV